MASKAYIARKERESREQMNQENIDQQEKQSKRQFVGNIISSVLGGAGRVIAARTKQDGSWYKQWIKDISNFVSLPAYSNSMLLERGKTEERYDAATGAFLASDLGNGVVMSFEYFNHIGLNTSEIGSYTFPINEGMTSTLSQIAKVNSRSVISDPDVMGFYVIMATELASKLAWLKENIEIASYFSPVQASIRNALLKARGVTNYMNFIDNIAQWRKTYQFCAHKFNAEIALPSGLSYVKRKVWVNSIVIKDCRVLKAQYYTFNPVHFIEPDDDWVEQAQLNQVANIPATPGLFESWFTQITEQFSLDSDLATILANIRAAVNEKLLTQLPLEFDSAPTMIEANDEVLMQFHNIKTLPYGLRDAHKTNTSWFINFTAIKTDGQNLFMDRTLKVPAALITDAHWVGSKQAFAMAHYCNKGKEVLDYYKDNLVDDDYTVGTRLHATYGVDMLDANNKVTQAYASATHFELGLSGCGTEIVVCAVSYHYSATNEIYDDENAHSAAPYETLVCTYMPGIEVPSTYYAKVNYTIAMSQVSQYDWMFPVYRGEFDGNGTELCVHPFCEFANVFTVATFDLNKVHGLCDKSLFYLAPDSFKAKFF